MEKHTLRTFDHLDIPEKVRAVLGVVREPIEKVKALSLAGVRYEQLSAEKKAAVEAIFTSPETEITESSKDTLFKLSESARLQLAEVVDLPSVHAQIGNVFMQELGFDE
jgi:hypothetical protein